MILEVSHVQKIYSNVLGGNKTEALKDVDFSVNEGEFVAIMGESGSGKTTLLNIIATFDQATKGKVIISGQDISKYNDSQLADFRRDQLGFVFQSFNLLDTFSIKDNILLPLVLTKCPIKEMESRLEKVAHDLGITELLNKYPYQVSGGQAQRAAVARAIITNPKLLLADEPTGALDSKSTDQLLEVFAKINQQKQTILMVTHSIKSACYANRVLFIKDGVVFHELYRGELSTDQMYEKISDSLRLLQAGERHD